jgi:S-DNA-T family DNA segregation ATPase FtsK/SpoIIIE
VSDDLQPELNAALQHLRERALVTQNGGVLTGCQSFISRKLGCGYNRAARIIEQMEEQGVVSRADRVGRREVLVGDH